MSEIEHLVMPALRAAGRPTTCENQERMRKALTEAATQKRNQRTMSEISEKLLPCPFCGGEAEIIHIEDGENAGGSCVCCTQCLASSNVEFEFKENFVRNWNRRATRAGQFLYTEVRAEDWENACHALVWTNDPGLFDLIRNQAYAEADERVAAAEKESE